MNKWIFVSEIVVILLIIVISITILHKILSKPKEKQWELFVGEDEYCPQCGAQLYNEVTDKYFFDIKCIYCGYEDRGMLY